MFDFLKGGKARVSVELDRPSAPYVPGETIHAKVIVQGEKDLKIQNGRVALVYREEYERRYQDRDTDSQGHTTHTSRKDWETDEQAVWQHQFLEETTIRGGSNQTFEFAMPLPQNAPPTLEGGKILRGQWLVKTTLDRKLAGDVEDKRETFVFHLPTGRMGGAGTYGYSNEPVDAEMQLVLSNKEFALGETITGELIIRPKKEFDVTEIRVETARQERVPQDEGNEHNENKAVKLAGGVKLAAGQELKYPFQLSLSTGSPITARTRHGSITWLLRGVLARRMRGDTHVEEEIFVFSDRPR